MPPQSDANRTVLRLASALVVAVLALGLVSVLAPAGAQESESDDDESTDVPFDHAAEHEERRAAVQECLEAAGIDVPVVEEDADGRPVRPDLSDEERDAIHDALVDCDIPPPPHGHRGLRHVRLHHALASCLEEQGVPVPEHDEGAGGPPELTDEQQGALEACRARFEQAREQVRACVEAQGIELPSEGWHPGPYPGSGPGPWGHADVDLEGLRDAIETCRSEIEAGSSDGASVDDATTDDVLSEPAVLVRA